MSIYKRPSWEYFSTLYASKYHPQAAANFEHPTINLNTSIMEFEISFDFHFIFYCHIEHYVI